MQEVKSAFSVNFSFDNWTSVSNTNFIAISGHYITNQFEMKDRCLVLEKYDTSHSAADMRAKLEQLLQQYNLVNCSATLIDPNGDEDADKNFLGDDHQHDGQADSDEVDEEDANFADSTTPGIPIVFTTDNAPALVAAMDKEGWFRMCCFAHVTALAVNAANKVPSIKKWK